MKRRNLLIMAVILIFILLVGCQKKEPPVKSEYTKYSYSFIDTFDTVTQVVGYTKTEEEFNAYAEKIHERMLNLHKLYDKYNDYEGINNIKTINDYAGVKPVKVDKDIIDLIIFSKQNYEEISTKTNIAMGAVLNIWHDYREAAILNSADAALPPMNDLLAANEHTDINKVIVDVENSTVYLDDPLMSLDVGAVAKGYATEVVVQEVVKDGFTSGIINAGGNVRAFGVPMDGVRSKWSVGIQNPDSYTVDSGENVLETVFLTDESVVTSGDYQRFYMIGDKMIHHLIDPETLMPGDYFRAVSIVTENSGLADFLSTAVFLTPYEEGRKLVESSGAEAMWVFKDGTIEATEGMKKIMESQGATAAIQ